MLGKHNLKKLLKKYYPLLAILIGVTLVSIAMGPYLTLDTDLEFSTAQGVLRWGYPYINAWGNLFNEPPLGFYTEAAVFQVFGFSVANGVALVTLFGLACTIVVYKLGKELYNETTGLFAAAFFALAPWELVLSRSFLIDVQCLLFNLVFVLWNLGYSQRLRQVCRSCGHILCCRLTHQVICSFHALATVAPIPLPETRK
jgi:4-amino-4-deoxy-L-arabinose transferase-like glycosyltransferase